MFTIAHAAARYIVADLPDDVTLDFLTDRIEDTAWDVLDRPMFAELSEANHEEAVYGLADDIARAIMQDDTAPRAVRAFARVIYGDN